MLQKLCKLNTEAGRGDGVGIIENGQINLPQTQKVYMPGDRWPTEVPVVDDNGYVAVSRSFPSNGPEGMRYIGRVGNTQSAQYVAQLFQEVNGPGTCVLHPVKGQKHFVELYVTPIGTGTLQSREQIENFFQAMIRMEMHSTDIQNALIPLLDDNTREAYQASPKGTTLWTALVGQNPYDMQLPEKMIDTIQTPEMQALRDKLFMIPTQEGIRASIAIKNGLNIYHDSDGSIERVYRVQDPGLEGMVYLEAAIHGDKALWTNRLCNYINAINEQHLFGLSETADGTALYCSPDVAISVDDISNLRFLLTTTSDTMRQEIADLIPHPELKQLYVNHPGPNTAWIGLTGTDPRYFDEPWDVEHVQENDIDIQEYDEETIGDE